VVLEPLGGVVGDAYVEETSRLVEEPVEDVLSGEDPRVYR
jgi:hypothetical protein